MITYTPEQFLASPAFMEIVTREALELVAKTNNQSVSLAAEAFALGVPNVLREVAKLVAGAAIESAEHMNKQN